MVVIQTKLVSPFTPPLVLLVSVCMCAYACVRVSELLCECWYFTLTLAVGIYLHTTNVCCVSIQSVCVSLCAVWTYIVVCISNMCLWEHIGFYNAQTTGGSMKGERCGGFPERWRRVAEDIKAQSGFNDADTSTQMRVSDVGVCPWNALPKGSGNRFIDP